MEKTFLKKIIAQLTYIERRTSQRIMHDSTPAIWQTTRRQLTADCRIFQVYTEHCTQPIDGREGDFFFLECPDWVQVLALTPQQEILLVRQFRFGTKRLSLEIPGGILDPDETPIEAAIRELREETGYAGSDPQILMTIYPNPAIMNNRLFTVLISRCHPVGEQKLDPNEEIACSKIPVQQIWQRIRNGDIDHGVALDALLFLKLYIEDHPETFEIHTAEPK
jgi:8-oxo-dGTP pyrophosphatase MutT (NUDIX family)